MSGDNIQVSINNIHVLSNNMQVLKNDTDTGDRYEYRKTIQFLKNSIRSQDLHNDQENE